MELLKDSPFVFRDAIGRPFRVQIWSDDPWLFYWRDGWISLRKLTQLEVWQFEKDAIPKEEVERLYSIRF